MLVSLSPGPPSIMHPLQDQPALSLDGVQRNLEKNTTKKSPPLHTYRTRNKIKIRHHEACWKSKTIDKSRRSARNTQSMYLNPCLEWTIQSCMFFARGFKVSGLGPNQRVGTASHVVALYAAPKTPEPHTCGDNEEGASL